MPTYEYQCEACKHEFAQIMSIAERERQKVACPECESDKVKQLVSTFIAQTSKKS